MLLDAGLDSHRAYITRRAHKRSAQRESVAGLLEGAHSRKLRPRGTI